MSHLQTGHAALVVRLTFIFVLLAALTGSGTAAISAATLSVTTLADSGAGSLRQAIADATPGDTITFGVTGTIVLTSGPLVVAKNLTLSGPGAASLSLSGNVVSRVITNSAHLAISGLTIRNGEAGAGSGGGILNAGSGVLMITRSVITANRAQKGGGIFNSPGGDLQVTDSIISANFTRLMDVGLDASGAGIYNAGPGGVVGITNSTFTSNDVHDNGSGLYNDAAATVANSTFTLSQASTAAVYNDSSGSLQLNNVTITLNSGRKDATGLLSNGGTVSVANSVIANNHTVGGGNNTSLPDCGVTHGGTLTSGGHNLIGNATGCSISAGTGDKLGSDVAPIDAKLGPLTNNGGPTSTHTLLVGSPAIDAGSPAAPGSGSGACESADQRGAARPVQGATSPTCDIGAVEIGSTPPATPSLDTVAPTPGGPPVQGFVTGAASGFPVRLAWTPGMDAGSGIASYILQRRLDAGAFATIANPTSTLATVSLGAGHTYAFRVASVDGAGNVSSFVAGPAFKALAYQERSSAIRYSSGWALSNSTNFWGGHAKYTRTRLASAKVTFSGRNFAWVAPTNRFQGRARVYVDGHLVTTVNLYSAVSRSRQIVFTRAWSRSGTHTVRIVGLATAGHPRVTVDAFLALR